MIRSAIAVLLVLACLPAAGPAARPAPRDGDPREVFFRRNAGDPLPEDTRHLRFLKVRSELLSRFHGRPVTLRAGLLLPRGWDRDTGRKYPLWIRIGGFGSRYTFVREAAEDGGGPPEDPPVLILCLDGFGPYGDPSQVNSANNGPYGDAVTRELVPHVEREFRGIGRPYARFLSGHSTGGWAALALQLFYPDFFNGAYAFWPDPVDFRAFETIDIYRDENAYFDESGEERAAVRDHRGRTRRTVREQCMEENDRGGGLWTLSRGQWGAWNAIYSPRGPDGHPLPLWHPRSGKIDRKVAEQWRRYDLRLLLERNWKTLGPKVRDRLHIWVGERDDYFLNEAVHLLDRFLRRANPPFTGRVTFDPDGGHGGFRTIGQQQMMREMAAAVARAEGAAR